MSGGVSKRRRLSAGEYEKVTGRAPAREEGPQVSSSSSLNMSQMNKIAGLAASIGSQHALEAAALERARTAPSPSTLAALSPGYVDRVPTLRARVDGLE